MTDKLREALTFYGNMQNWQDGGFTRTARNTMTLIMSTAMKDRGERARAALAAAPQPAPEEREALVDADSLSRQIGELGNQIHNLGCEYQNDEKLSERLGELRATAWDLERRAHALLARGLRLQGDETMAWAVVGESGEIELVYVGHDRRELAEMIAEGTRRKPVRVAIRVVEGGDDA